MAAAGVAWRVECFCPTQLVLVACRLRIDDGDNHFHRFRYPPAAVVRGAAVVGRAWYHAVGQRPGSPKLNFRSKGATKANGAVARQQ